MSEPPRERLPDKLKRLFGRRKTVLSVPLRPVPAQPVQSTSARNVIEVVEITQHEAISNVNVPVEEETAEPSTSLVEENQETCSEPLSTNATETPGRRNLWDEARSKLPDGQRATLDKIRFAVGQDINAPLETQMDDLIKHTKEKQQYCDEKKLKFNFMGEEIISRASAEKVIVFLNKFKTVGDVAVSFDPQHAALPWAGVRFLIQAVVGSHQQMGALLLTTEKVTYLLNRCTVYESLYLTNTFPSTALQNFESALVELYVVILQLIILASSFCSYNKAVRALKATFDPEKVPELVKSCQERENRVEIEANNCDRKVDQKVLAWLGDLEKPISRIDENVIGLLKLVDKRERNELLNWMSSSLYGDYHSSVNENRTENTCQWILDHDSFKQWQKSNSSTILWLHGLAGTGKTYLTSRVIKDIREKLEKTVNHEGFAYFYCNRNEADRQQPLNILRSIVRQLSCITHETSKVRTSLEQLRENCNSDGRSPNVKDCIELLHTYVNTYPATTIVLDALDECDKEQRHVLIELFDELVNKSESLVKIFISSRPDVDIKDRFQQKSNIRIQATDNQTDISVYLRDKIRNHTWAKSSESSESFREEVIKILEKGANGMFQWAYLQVQQLSGFRMRDEVEKCLGKLPKDLEAAYSGIIDGMEDHHRPYFQRAAQWIMAAPEPLESAVLLEAVCQDPSLNRIVPRNDLSEEILLEYCHHILVIDTRRGVWMPSHLSVREFLEIQDWTREAHCMIASVTLMALLDDETRRRFAEGIPGWDDPNVDLDDIAWELREEIEQRKVLGTPLYVYSCANWMFYAQRVEHSDYVYSAEKYKQLLEQFLSQPDASSLAYEAWLKLSTLLEAELWIGTRQEAECTWFIFAPRISAYAICAFGLYFSTSSWWGAEPWAFLLKDAKQMSALLRFSIISESLPICKHLVSWGADLEIKVELEEYDVKMAPLARAAELGNTELVKLFLESGAKVDSLVDIENAHHVPLTIGFSDDGESVVSEAGKKRCRQFDSALTLASKAGNLAVVEALLQYGATIDTFYNCGCYYSALCSAIASDHFNMDIFQLLFDACLEDDALWKQTRWSMALAKAAYKGNLALMERLLDSDRGAIANAKLRYEDEYGSPLVAAAARNHENAVKLLLEKGADANTLLTTGRYGSALIAASRLGSESIVQLLVENGAKVNAVAACGHYGSALIAVSYNGRTSTIRYLIEHGAQVDAVATCGNYGSALIAAFCSHKSDPTREFTEKVADVNAAATCGRFGSAFITVSHGTRVGKVRYLIAKGAEVNAVATCGHYGSALIAASCRGEESIVQLLVENGAEVNAVATCGHYGSALIAAAATARFHSARKNINLLINRGVDVNLSVEVGDYCNALVAAVIEGNQSIVELLLEAGVDVNMSLHYGGYRNALHAVRNAHYESFLQTGRVRAGIMDMLLKAGAVDDEL